MMVYHVQELLEFVYVITNKDEIPDKYMFRKFKTGDIVKRINSSHGNLKVGDTSIIVRYRGESNYVLESDKSLLPERDVSHAEGNLKLILARTNFEFWNISPYKILKKLHTKNVKNEVI